MMKAGTFKTGNVDSAGRLRDRTAETIELYEGIIDKIGEALDRIKNNS